MGCKASRPQLKPGKGRRRALSLEGTTANVKDSSTYRDLVRTSSLKEGKAADGLVSTEGRFAVDRAATYHDQIPDSSSQKAMVSSESSFKPVPTSTMTAVRPPLPTTTAEASAQGLQSDQGGQNPVIPVNLANIPHTPYPGMGQPLQRAHPPRQQNVPVAVPTDVNHPHHNSEFAKNVREHQRIAPLPAGANIPEYDYKRRNDGHQKKEHGGQNRNNHRQRHHHRRRRHSRYRRHMKDEDDTLYEVGNVMPEVDADYNDDFYRRKGLNTTSLIATWGQEKTTPGASVGIREEAAKFTAS